MNSIRTLGLFLTVLATVSLARAGIRPSFFPEVCSWRATDIVIVTEGGEVDGVFTILETLKGDLKSGATIKIPEMAAFKAIEARTISPSWSQKPVGTAQSVTGQRMILFLRDATKTAMNTDLNDDEYLKSRLRDIHPRWQSANVIGDEVKYSTVWIEHGQVYYFIQMMNPGPSLLTKTGTTEDQLRKEVAQVISVQDGLSTAIAIQDPSRKAQSLEPFLHSEIELAREKAFAELINCDEAAVPVLKAVLSDESLIWIHADAIDALEAVSGRAVGPYLTAILEREIEFWKQRAPTLKPSWQNEFDPKGDSALLRRHWSILEQTLQSLKDIRYAGSQKPLAALSQLMSSMPQLHDEEINNTCDAILRFFRSKDEMPAIPSYELQITGNKIFPTQKLREVFAQALTDYQHLEIPHDDDMFVYALDRVGNFISSQGFTAMGSGPPPKESPDDSKDVVISSIRAADHTQAAIGKNARGVVVFLHVNEGKRYRLGSVTIHGARLFSPAELRGRLQLQSGDLCDFVAIANWRSSIERAYRNRGYLQVSVEDGTDMDPPTRGADSGTVNFKITVDEGRPFKVRSIKFEGKSDVPAPTLFGALKLAEGDLYSEDKLDASLNALNTLGLNIEKESDVQTQEDEHGAVSLVIILDKWTARHASAENQLRTQMRRIFN